MTLNPVQYVGYGRERRRGPNLYTHTHHVCAQHFNVSFSFGLPAFSGITSMVWISRSRTVVQFTGEVNTVMRDFFHRAMQSADFAITIRLSVCLAVTF